MVQDGQGGWSGDKSLAWFVAFDVFISFSVFNMVASNPGSCLHLVRALAHPRWEDFNYEMLDGHPNRFHWLGNGWTVNERDECGNRAYRTPDFIQFN